MKRQARPFVVETKRSRKAPTNLWASTPLLQQELAAASAPEPRAEAIFADRSKDLVAEPARRILQSLIVETPAAEAEAEEPEEPAASRRRTRRDVDSDGETRPEPARRGRPRRIITTADGEAIVSDASLPTVVAAKAEAALEATRSKAPAARRSAGKAAATEAAVSKARETRAPADVSPVTAAPVRTQAAPAAPALAARPDAAVAETDATAATPAPRARMPRNPAATALPPGQRWKRRLPQRLW